MFLIQCIIHIYVEIMISNTRRCRDSFSHFFKWSSQPGRKGRPGPALEQGDDLEGSKKEKFYASQKK